MKSFKKLVGGLILGAGMLLGTAFNANAIVITQEILVDDGFSVEVYGEVSFEMSSKNFNSGDIIMSGFDKINFVSMTHDFGFAGTSQVNDFSVVFDSALGSLEFLSFDGVDDFFFAPWGYQYLIDATVPFGFVEIDEGNFVFNFIDGLSFGAVSVNTPATIALFSLALVGAFAVRRRS